MSYVGHIKSFNSLTGWGFVACEETKALYGKDIILHSRHKGNVIVKAGDQVEFDVVEGKKGPEAHKIKVLDHGKFPEPRPEEMEEGWFVGNIKSYNPVKGWGFITCPETYKLYEKDIFIMKTRDKGVIVNAGNRVRFTVKDGEKGPEADEVKVLDEHGIVLEQKLRDPSDPKPVNKHVEQAKAAKAKGKGKANEVVQGKGKDVKEVWIDGQEKGLPKGSFIVWTNDPYAFGKGMGPPGMGPPGKGKGPLHHKEATGGQAYTGTIKSWNEKRGWGFIQCEDTELVYGKDILVHHKNVGAVSFEIGDEVTFSVHDGEQGPEAIEVVAAPAYAPVRTGAAKGAASKASGPYEAAWGKGAEWGTAADWGKGPDYGNGAEWGKGVQWGAGADWGKGAPDPWGKGGGVLEKGSMAADWGKGYAAGYGKAWGKAPEAWGPYW